MRPSPTAGAVLMRSLLGSSRTCARRSRARCGPAAPPNPHGRPARMHWATRSFACRGPDPSSCSNSGAWVSASAIDCAMAPSRCCTGLTSTCRRTSRRSTPARRHHQVSPSRLSRRPGRLARSLAVVRRVRSATGCAYLADAGRRRDRRALDHTAMRRASVRGEGRGHRARDAHGSARGRWPPRCSPISGAGAVPSSIAAIRCRLRRSPVSMGSRSCTLTHDGSAIDHLGERGLSRCRRSRSTTARGQRIDRRCAGRLNVNALGTTSAVADSVRSPASPAQRGGPSAAIDAIATGSTATRSRAAVPRTRYAGDRAAASRPTHRCSGLPSSSRSRAWRRRRSPPWPHS